MLKKANSLKKVVFGERSDDTKDEATLDDLVTGAVLRPYVKDVGFKPPVLIMDDYRRKWSDVKFSAALPLGKHAVQKTKGLSTKEFECERLTKETIVRPSYFGLTEKEDEYEGHTSQRIDVHVGNLSMDIEPAELSYDLDVNEKELIRDFLNDDKLLTVLGKDSSKKRKRIEREKRGEYTYTTIIIVAEDETVIDEYEETSHIYVRDGLQSGLDIKKFNGNLYHDEVPTPTNEPDTYKILKTDEETLGM